MLLSELFKNAPNIDIKQLSCDSRSPMVDSMFFCLRGVQFDGHNYIEEAVQNGAKVVIYDGDVETKCKAIYIKVNNVSDTLKQISNKFYDYPSKNMETYLVNGCYDKEVVTYLINKIISHFRNVGSIGLNGITYNDINLTTDYATLQMLNTQKHLNDMRNSGVEACTFEASSLSLQYDKLSCVDFDTFIYTRTGFNSIDYIEGGTNYYDCIRKYLYSLDNTKIILNIDDVSYDELCQCSDNVITYGSTNNADYLISSIKISSKGSTFSLSTKFGDFIIKTKMIGFNNVYNVTAAIVALAENGYDINEIRKYVEDIPRLEGRYEYIENNDNLIYIDSAKSLDEYEDIFKFSYKVTNRNNKIIAVVSINNYDDENKIESLVKLIEEYVDHVVFVPDELGDFIKDRLDYAYKTSLNIKAISIEDREYGIEEAFNLLNNKDTLLILGKGKENVIYNGNDKVHYDSDKEIIIRLLKDRMENGYEEI